MSAQPRMSAAAFRKGAGRPLERSVQVPLYTWLRANVSSCVWHTRNEGHRSDLGRMRDAAEGVVSGVADLGGSIEYGPHAGRLFGIEVKRPGSTDSDVTANQRWFGRMVVERGGLWTWCCSTEAAQTWCRAQGIVRPAGWVAPWAVRQIEEFAL